MARELTPDELKSLGLQNDAPQAPPVGRELSPEELKAMGLENDVPTPHTAQLTDPGGVVDAVQKADHVVRNVTGALEKINDQYVDPAIDTFKDMGNQALNAGKWMSGVWAADPQARGDVGRVFASGLLKGGGDEAGAALRNATLSNDVGVKDPTGHMSKPGMNQDRYRALRDVFRQKEEEANGRLPAPVRIGADVAGNTITDLGLAAAGLPVYGPQGSAIMGGITGLLGSDAELTPGKATPQSVARAGVDAAKGVLTNYVATEVGAPLVTAGLGWLGGKLAARGAAGAEKAVAPMRKAAVEDLAKAEAQGESQAYKRVVKDNAKAVAGSSAERDRVAEDLIKGREKDIAHTTKSQEGYKDAIAKLTGAREEQTRKFGDKAYKDLSSLVSKNSSEAQAEKIADLSADVTDAANSQKGKLGSEYSNLYNFMETQEGRLKGAISQEADPIKAQKLQEFLDTYGAKRTEGVKGRALEHLENPPEKVAAEFGAAKKATLEGRLAALQAKGTPGMSSQEAATRLTSVPKIAPGDVEAVAKSRMSAAKEAGVLRDPGDKINVPLPQLVPPAMSAEEAASKASAQVRAVPELSDEQALALAAKNGKNPEYVRRVLLNKMLADKLSRGNTAAGKLPQEFANQMSKTPDIVPDFLRSTFDKSKLLRGALKTTTLGALSSSPESRLQKYLTEQAVGELAQGAAPEAGKVPQTLVEYLLSRRKSREP